MTGRKYGPCNSQEDAREQTTSEDVPVNDQEKGLGRGYGPCGRGLANRFGQGRGRGFGRGRR